MPESTPPPPPPGATPPTAEQAPGPSPVSGVSLRGTAGFGLVAAVLLAVAVSVKEDGSNDWSRFGVWAGFAIACALMTVAPAGRERLGLSAPTAWRVATAGGVGLAAYWVLFVLPWIEQNTSFVATLGCALGAYAAWIAPGRPPSARAQSF